MTDDVAKVAASLTPAQKRLLAGIEQRAGLENAWTYLAKQNAGASANALCRKGLIERDWYECGAHGYLTLSPLGLAIHRHLHQDKRP